LLIAPGAADVVSICTTLSPGRTGTAVPVTGPLRSPPPLDSITVA
jgi:hypothetical protein